MTVDTIDTLESLGMIKNNINVLDVGCGYGNWAKDFIRRGYDINYIGLDINMGRIMDCESNIVHKNYAFRLMDVSNISYNPVGKKLASEAVFPVDGSWAELVICHSLFTHLGSLSNAQHYMSEIIRILKPQGFLWITFFKSPPNEVDYGTMRTSYLETDLEQLLASFNKLHCNGGESTDHNDQVMIGARKK